MMIKVKCPCETSHIRAEAIKEVTARATENPLKEITGENEQDCRDCIFFLGCECFSGIPCECFSGIPCDEIKKKETEVIKND